MEDKEDWNTIIKYRRKLEEASNFQDIWRVIKSAVKDSLGQHRSGMMLFLDDLPLRVGAYHSFGTNNIVMNRALLEIVEVSVTNPLRVKAFIFQILLHEYLHALGYIRERDVQKITKQISQHCFGSNHEIVQLAQNGPWSIIKNLKKRPIQVPQRNMEIVKDLDPPTQTYFG